MRLRLQDEAQINPAPESVCDGCFRMLAKMVSKGAVLRAEQKAKEHNRLMLWRNRVQLVKQAKQHLAQKNNADAAISYEKYLRVLELIYEVGQGELSPDLFKNQARAQEMTVIASVYWDLLRIYDTHQSYQERQMKAAEKLASFIRFTPIFPHVIRKAETFTRTSKNPDAFKKFLKLSNAQRPRCFIATSAYDGERTETIDTLCLFRDQFLKESHSGRKLVTLYYKVSPRLAELLDRHPSMKPATRKALSWLAKSDFVRNRLKS